MFENIIMGRAPEVWRGCKVCVKIKAFNFSFFFYSYLLVSPPILFTLKWISLDLYFGTYFYLFQIYKTILSVSGFGFRGTVWESLYSDLWKYFHINYNWRSLLHPGKWLQMSSLAKDVSLCWRLLLCIFHSSEKFENSQTIRGNVAAVCDHN